MLNPIKTYNRKMFTIIYAIAKHVLIIIIKYIVEGFANDFGSLKQLLEAIELSMLWSLILFR
jgi:hypothetical protein